MAVKLQRITYYCCVCDNCQKNERVDRSALIYNGAQAVRSLGWSFGKDGKVLCKTCRMRNYDDHYRWFH